MLQEEDKEIKCVEIFNINVETKGEHGIKVGKKLGEGAFSKAYEYKDGKIFKKTKIKNMDRLEFQNLVLQIYLNKKYEKTDNPIPKIDSFGYIKKEDHTDPEYLYIIMENAGKDINKHLEENSLSVLEKIKLFKKLVLAVKFIHDKNFLHRELKLDNMTIKGDKIFLIDLGFMGHRNIKIDGDEFKKIKEIQGLISNNKHFKDNEKFKFLKDNQLVSDCHDNLREGLNCNKYCGTQSFISPELVGKFSQNLITSGNKYSKNPKIIEGCQKLFQSSPNEIVINQKSDVYSLGMMLLYMLNFKNDQSSNYPFENFSNSKIDKDLLRINNLCLLQEKLKTIDMIGSKLKDNLESVFKNMNDNLRKKTFELVRKTLEFDPRKRIDTSEIINICNGILNENTPVNLQKGGKTKKRKRNLTKKVKKKNKKTRKKRNKKKTLKKNR